jgi:transforming growth factor-beta-induced protein
MTKVFTLRTLSLSLITLAMLISSCSSLKKDLVGVTAEKAKTLNAAVTAAGLATTLKGTGPFTIFAPSDAAFLAIQSDVDILLKPENKAALAKILTGHVVNGKIMAADIKNGQVITTIDGTKLLVSIINGKVMVGDATVTLTDLMASNGVAHMINKVLLPLKPKTKDIVDIAVESAKTLAAAVTAAGLVETLRGNGPFTVFAPTDAAFASIQKEVDNLLKPENKTKLTKVLTYHVVYGKLMAADLKDGQLLTTVEGSQLRIAIKNGKVMINDAVVATADVNASNGVIHVIDKVVLPKM